MTAEEEEGVKGKKDCLPIVLGVLAVLLVIGTACGKEVYDGCPKKADGSLDCSHQDLSGSDLRELDFSGADFSGANLNGADFYKAYLWNANFSGANLSGANLKEADLRNAHLSGLDLSEEDMFEGADLSGANLSGANLSGSDLRDVNFSGADLRGADLRGADFSGGWRPVANLSGADLRDANLSGADFSGTNLKGANLAGVDLSGLDLSKSDLTGADLKGVTADTNTEWPEGFDTKAAGVITTTTTTTTTAAPTTTVKPLSRGFTLPPDDVIDRKVRLVISGKYPIGDTRAGGYDLVTINARNSGDQPAYYRIIMKYGLLDEAPANYEFAEDFDWGFPGLSGGLGVIQVAYCTETSVPADGKERKLELAIQNEPGDEHEHNAGWFLAEPHDFFYRIDVFSKRLSPC